ncbi:MAG: sialidase family protein [bacterium]
MRRICILTVMLSLFWGREALCARAQAGPVDWSRPVNLSNTPQNSAHPTIVADDYGYVHVFWSEEVGGRPMGPGDTVSNTGNTILYKRWDGVSWSPTVDILFVPGEVLAEFPAVDIDAENRLHLVWEAISNLYYSSAPSSQAASAHAWTKPVVLANNTAAVAWGSDIAVDAHGGLHVIYTTRGDDAGIYYIRSMDDGTSWQLPMKLSEPFASLEDSFSVVEIIADHLGKLHAVWQTSQAQGYGQAIYYARSTDRGESWGRPVQLGWRDPEDYEVAWPYLTAVAESELHLVYVDGPGIGSRGRYHRVSEDGGKTWTRPFHIVTEMVGVNGYVVPIADGAGQIHLIINMRTKDTQTVGIYYARWSGNGWSPVEPVDVSSPAAPSAHHMAGTLRRGNEVHVTYTQLAGGEIWHIYGVIRSVAADPVLPVPSPQKPVPSIEVTETALPASGHPSDATPQPTPTLESRSSLTSRVASHPLVPAVGVPLLLVITAVVWARLR